MIDRSVYSAENCSLASTLSIVGEKWTLLILREAFNGADRFEQFHRVLGCARNLLASRLEFLVEEGIFERVPYKTPGTRTRHRYVLTAKGADLIPGMIAFTHWGDRYLAHPQGPATDMVHNGCGGDVQVVLQCDRGHDGLTPEQIDPQPGSGALRWDDQPTDAAG